MTCTGFLLACAAEEPQGGGVTCPAICGRGTWLFQFGGVLCGRTCCMCVECRVSVCLVSERRDECVVWRFIICVRAWFWFSNLNGLSARAWS